MNKKLFIMALCMVGHSGYAVEPNMNQQWEARRMPQGDEEPQQWDEEKEERQRKEEEERQRKEEEERQRKEEERQWEELSRMRQEKLRQLAPAYRDQLNDLRQHNENMQRALGDLDAIIDDGHIDEDRKQRGLANAKAEIQKGWGTRNRAIELRDVVEGLKESLGGDEMLDSDLKDLMQQVSFKGVSPITTWNRQLNQVGTKQRDLNEAHKKQQEELRQQQVVEESKQQELRQQQVVERKKLEEALQELVEQKERWKDPKMRDKIENKIVVAKQNIAKFDRDNQ